MDMVTDYPSRLAGMIQKRALSKLPMPRNDLFFQTAVYMQGWTPATKDIIIVGGRLVGWLVRVECERVYDGERWWCLTVLLSLVLPVLKEVKHL